MQYRCLLIAIIASACGGGDDPDGVPDDAPAVSDDAPAVPGDVPATTGEPAGLAGITALHNQVRAMVQTSPALEPLTWDADLAATAAAWVAECRDQDAPVGLVDHNPDRSVGHPYYVGENVFASTGRATARAAVDSWADERNNYDYSANACPGGDQVCGHYTQLVWRSTRKVGCALGNCPGITFSSTIVCDYGPGGNVSGQRPY